MDISTTTQISLVAALLSLMLGALLGPVSSGDRTTARFLDGFIVVSIGGIVLLELLPEALAEHGFITLLWLLAGLYGPTLLERVMHSVARQTHILTLIISLCGLILHASFDGAALAGGEHHGHGDLTLSIILHRLPVGLAVWWLLRPNFGVWAVAAGIFSMAVATIAGTLGVIGHGGDWHSPAFEAFIAGSILHVVFNRPHIADQDHPIVEAQPAPAKSAWVEGAGNILAFILLAVLAWIGYNQQSGLPESVNLFIDLAAAAAPALLIAYVIGGALAVYLPESSIRWLKRGTKLGQASKGVLFGLPLPVCSCGVVPLYKSLVERGAPPTAAMAFLIATPELGIDAVLLSFPLLGIDMTVARIVAAFAIALAIGWLVGGYGFRKAQSQQHQPGCCHGHSNAPEKSILGALRYGLHDLVDSTAPWIIAGLAIAVIAAPILNNLDLSGVPSYVQVLIFAVLGMPIYVCAAGATPIVAVFIAAGVSPGAALAFLLTGPATNITTFGLLRQLHGQTIAIMFGVSTASAAIITGIVLDYWLPTVSIMDTIHEHQNLSTLQLICLALLTLLFALSLVRQGARKFFGEISLTGIKGHTEHKH